MKQQTPEWFAERCGRATASCFADILAKTKSGPAASRKNYMALKLCERLTGVPAAPGYTNADMQWGIDQEPFARMAIEESGIIINEVGFIRHKTLMAGCSPDGLIDADGMAEIKCPKTANHIETLRFGMPPEHIPQVQGQLWVAERKYCIFASYDPRMPPGMQLYTQRIERDEAYIERLEAEVKLFLDELAALIKELENKYGKRQ